jgi:hypothetical protein
MAGRWRRSDKNFHGIHPSIVVQSAASDCVGCFDREKDGEPQLRHRFSLQENGYSGNT